MSGMQSAVRVLVCGGRDFNNFDLVCDVLGDLPIEDLCHGCARGADAMAQEWANDVSRRGCRPIRVHRFPADWQTHGKAAGPIRNQRMLDVFRPDLVVAFPGGRGTADMVQRARKAGVEVMEVAPEP